MKYNKKMLMEVVGWYGSLALVLAFALNNFGVLGAKDWAYQLLNMTGASAIVAISIYKKVYQTAALNTLWAMVAVVAMVSMIIGG